MKTKKKNLATVLNSITFDSAAAMDIEDLMQKLCEDEDITPVAVTKRKKLATESRRSRGRRKAQSRMRLEKILFPARADRHPEDFQRNHFGRFLNHGRFDHFDRRPYGVRPYIRKTNHDYLHDIGLENE